MVTGISADGKVAVGDVDGQTGFRYTLATAAYEPLSFPAYDVNGDGSIVVGINRTTNRIHQWSGGVSAELSDLPMLAGTVVIAPHAYKLAGYTLYSTTGTFLYDGSSVTTLPVTSGEPTGFSSDGSVLVGAAFEGAFRYENGILTNLGPQGLNWVNGISGDGSTLIGFADELGGAYFNSTGVYQIPPPYVSTSDFVNPTAISGDGSVIAGSFASWPDDEAFYWIAPSGTMPLSTLVSVPDGWFLARVFDVSADGSVMVGQAWNMDGSESRGFIISGITSFQPVPEPSTYGVIAGMVLLGLIGLRRRSRR